jgi:phosphohistidine phosphatase SixA
VEGSLCLVGHNNQLSVAAGLLLGGTVERIRTGEAVVLDVDPRDPVGSGGLVCRLRLPREHADARG